MKELKEREHQPIEIKYDETTNRDTTNSQSFPFVNNQESGEMNATTQSQNVQLSLSSMIEGILTSHKLFLSFTTNYYQQIESMIETISLQNMKNNQNETVESFEEMYNQYSSTRNEIVALLEQLKTISQSSELFSNDLMNLQTKIYIKQLSLEASINNTIDSLLQFNSSSFKNQIDDSSIWKKKMFIQEDEYDEFGDE